MMSLCAKHPTGERHINTNSAPSHRQPALINPPRSISAVRKMHQHVAGRRRANLRDKPLPRLQETQPYPSHVSLRASSNQSGLRFIGRLSDEPPGFTSGGNVDDKERSWLRLWFMIYEISIIYFESHAQEVFFHILPGLLLVVVQVNQFISSEQRLSAWGENREDWLLFLHLHQISLRLDSALNPTPAFILSHPLFLLYSPPLPHPLPLISLWFLIFSDILSLRN